MLKKDEIILREFIKETIDKESLLLEGAKEGIGWWIFDKAWGLAKSIGHRPAIPLAIGGAASAAAIKSSLDSIHGDYRGMLAGDLTIDVLQTGIDSIGYGVLRSKHPMAKYAGGAILVMAAIAGAIHYLDFGPRVFGVDFSRGEADGWGALFSVLPAVGGWGSAALGARRSFKLSGLEEEEKIVLSVLKLISHGKQDAALKQLADIGEDSLHVGLIKFKKAADKLIKKAQRVNGVDFKNVRMFDDGLLETLQGDLTVKAVKDFPKPGILFKDMNAGSVIEMDPHVKINGEAGVKLRKIDENSLEFFIEDADGLTLESIFIDVDSISSPVDLKADPRVKKLLSAVMDSSSFRKPIEEMFDNSGAFNAAMKLSNKKVGELSLAISTLNTRSRVTSLKGIRGLEHRAKIKDWVVYGHEGETKTRFIKYDEATGSITLDITFKNAKDETGENLWRAGERMKTYSRFGIDIPGVSLLTPRNAKAQRGEILWSDVIESVSPDGATATVKINVIGELDEQYYKRLSSLLYQSRNGAIIDAMSRGTIGLNRDYSSDQSKKSSTTPDGE